MSQYYPAYNACTGDLYVRVHVTKGLNCGVCVCLIEVSTNTGVHFTVNMGSKGCDLAWCPHNIGSA